MGNLITRTTELAMSVTLTYIKPGDTVIDATCGTGKDTIVLARAVGDEGSVYAIDIQKSAHLLTEARLKSHGIANVHLVMQSFVSMCNHIPEKSASAVVFNLGYLPGSDKSVTTLRESTMKAVEAALRLLEDDGGLLIAVYPGHEEGTLEGNMLTEYFSTLDRRKICISQLRIVNSPTSPFFFLVEKR